MHAPLRVALSSNEPQWDKLIEKKQAHSYCCCVVYPTPSEGWGHGRRPWCPRIRATPQGLDQRSYRDRESPKSERRKPSVAGQCRMRSEASLDECPQALPGRILDSANPREIRI